MRSPSLYISALVILGTGLIFSGCTQTTDYSEKSLLSEEKFINPPLEARPGALWPWLNGYVDLAQISLELEEMKAKGMRGAIIWDIGSLVDPDGIIPEGPAFLGEESLRAIHHAIDEASRLGLELGIVASSSWNAGGAWIEPEHASKELRWSEIRVSGPASFSGILPLPERTTDHYYDLAILAMPHDENKNLSDPAAAIHLTSQVDESGRLSWEVPEGEWNIIRFICNNTGQPLVCPSPNSNGLVIDHLSIEAAGKHFSTMVDKLLENREDLGSLKLLMLDSYEVWHRTDWTPDFLDEFTNRYGYDPTSYLPALAGWNTGNEEITKRFMHDYRKLVGDLLVEDHFKAAREILNDYGLLLMAEGGHGGAARVDALKALGAADIPMGEFWNHRRFWVTKEAASAAHIYGRKFVNAESLTGWQHWQDGPAGYKRLFDVALCAGLNQVTFHTFAHNPPEAGLPGFAYHAGEHFNVNATWWNYSGPMLEYMSRCCYMLQQGHFVADACLYYGDQAPNLVPSRRIDPSIEPQFDESACYHCGRPKPVRVHSLGPGYDYDYVNEEVILTRMKVKNGKIILPGGLSYHVLVLPDREEISFDVLKKIEKLVKAGATVVGRKPLRSNSLKDYPLCDQEVSELADRIWRYCDGDRIKENAYGKGRVIWNIPLKEVLAEMQVPVDFQVLNIENQDSHINYIHRRTNEEEIYFVSNSSLDWEEVRCKFRVEEDWVPYLWRADDGTVEKCRTYQASGGFVSLSLKMPPASSVFVVFREDNGQRDIMLTDKKLFTGPSTGMDVSPWTEVEILPGDPEDPRIRIWEPGIYTLTNAEDMQSKVSVDTLPVRILPGPSWGISFPEGWGAPANLISDKLESWTASSDPGVKYFSGTATYINEIIIPQYLLDERYSLFLDLGDVKEVAEVAINDQKIGILWKKPFRVDITEFVEPGTNRLEVSVTNLWNNRIIGDLQPGQNMAYTRTNMKKRFSAESPLLTSGLMGPVVVRVAENLLPVF